MAEGDILRQLALEAIRALARSLDGSAAETAAFDVGRRVGDTLAGQVTLPDAARHLGLDDHPEALPSTVSDALLRGLAAAVADRAPAPAAPARPAPPWAAAGGTRDLVAATRRAMHDLNQPLTVILGYAAILKRAAAEPVRLEAAEQIVKEARKMNEIIAGLSRLARGLDAA